MGDAALLPFKGELGRFPRPLLGKWVTLGRSALQGRLSSLEDRAPIPGPSTGTATPLSPVSFPTPPLTGP